MTLLMLVNDWDLEGMMIRESSVGKNNGRTTIDDMRRKKYSHRVAEGKLEVFHRVCPVCGHHKMFSTEMKIWCTRCRYTIWK